MSSSRRHRWLTDNLVPHGFTLYSYVCGALCGSGADLSLAGAFVSPLLAAIALSIPRRYLPAPARVVLAALVAALPIVSGLRTWVA